MAIHQVSIPMQPFNPTPKVFARHARCTLICFRNRPLRLQPQREVFSVIRPSTDSTAAAASCAGDNGGITLPAGFCATVFADKLGHARHMVVAPNGVVYVNTWSGRYYGNDKPPRGGFLVALQDTNGDGHADVIKRFGDRCRTAAPAAPASRSITARCTPR